MDLQKELITNVQTKNRESDLKEVFILAESLKIIWLWCSIVDQIGAPTHNFAWPWKQGSWIKQSVLLSALVPGGPMAKTQHSQWRGPGFYAWLGN